jgi:hypothetical protein
MRTRSLLLGAVAAALVACGDDPPALAPVASAPATHPLSWSAAAGSGDDGSAIVLTASHPCEVRLRFEGALAGTLTMPSRTMRNGDVVRVHWHWDSNVRRGLSKVPPEDAAAEGRTESVTTRVRFGFSDAAQLERELMAWSRPGKGNAYAHSVAAPREATPLAVGTDVELLAVAMVDGEFTRTAFHPGPGGRSEIRVWGEQPGAAAQYGRLWLEVRPPEPTRSP